MAENDGKSKNDKTVQERYIDAKDDIVKVGNINKTTISECNSIKYLSENMEKYKFEVFKSNFKKDGVDISGINSLEELPSELKGEYDNFKLSDEQIKAIDSPYSKARDDVIGIISRRDEKINELIGEKNKEGAGKLSQLLDEAKSTLTKTSEDIQKKEEEIEVLKNKQPLKDEDKEKLKQLNEEKAKLIEDEAYLKAIIGEEKVEGIKSIDELREDCKMSAKATEATKKEAIKAMGGFIAPYAINGENVVYSDKKIEDKLGKYDKDMDRLYNVGQNIEDISNREQEQAQNQQYSQNQAKNGPTAGFVPGTGEGKETDEKSEKELSGMQCLIALGYNPSNITAKNSKQMLDAFVNAEPDQQLKIITDKDSQEALFESIKKANGRMTPVFAVKFNKTRNALLRMANNSMLRKSLETIGIDPKNMGKEEVTEKFNEEFNKYQYEKNALAKKINSLEDGEEKKKLQAELDELDNKYRSISGANDFREMTSKELYKLKNRVADGLDHSKTKTITGARSDENYKNENRGAIKSNVEDGMEKLRKDVKSEVEIGEFDAQEYKKQILNKEAQQKGAQQKGAKGDQQIDEKDIT